MQKLSANFHNICAILVLLLFVSACTQSRAPIVNRGFMVYDQNSHKSKKRDEIINGKKITIKQGDTLYGVASRHNISARDLISANNLRPPYFLRSGSTLKLPAKKYHQVAAGDTLYGISRQYGMNVNNLIASNNLQKPYHIRTGDRLKITGTSVAQNRSNYETRSKPRNRNIVRKSLDKVAGKSNQFSWPVKGKIISKFGPKSGGLYNDGINIKAAQGAPVKAAEDGVVAYVGSELRGYGNLVIIKHSKGWISAYAHLSKANVKRGDKVKQNSTIGLVGSSGNVKTAQLYFGLRKGRKAVNPQKYL
jgi:murein DD-endopeptidase MepM/ murein hydrolase activator NlpD